MSPITITAKVRFDLVSYSRITCTRIDLMWSIIYVGLNGMGYAKRACFMNSPIRGKICLFCFELDVSLSVCIVVLNQYTLPMNVALRR